MADDPKMAEDRAEGDPQDQAAERGAGEDMKARYREALAHKHGSSGAHRTAHGDKGEEAHSHGAGRTRKMFRRKAGG